MPLDIVRKYGHGFNWWICQDDAVDDDASKGHIGVRGLTYHYYYVGLGTTVQLLILITCGWLVTIVYGRHIWKLLKRRIGKIFGLRGWFKWIPRKIEGKIQSKLLLKSPRGNRSQWDKTPMSPTFSPQTIYTNTLLVIVFQTVTTTLPVLPFNDKEVNITVEALWSFNSCTGEPFAAPPNISVLALLYLQRRLQKTKCGAKIRRLSGGE